MIPERLTPRVERLGAIAGRNDGTDVGVIALELAAYMTEEGREEQDDALADFATRVDARFVVHELAIAELYRRIGAEEADDLEADATLYRIPVAYAEGQDADSIRAAVRELETGLDGDEVVARLEEAGLLRRVGNPANHTAVTVAPGRQGGAVAETEQ